MIGSILSSVGSNIGKYFGGGILSSIGRYAGKYLGNFLEQKFFHKKRIFHKYANLKESFTLSIATAGSPIPLIFGKNRVVGKIIWIDQIKNIAETSSAKQYFPHPRFLPFLKRTKSIAYQTNYKYLLSFAMCICEGEIKEISRVWHGDEIIDISQYNFRLYKGSPQQIVDPYIQKKMNGKAPAFRDLAYIFFEDLPLEDFDNVIPNLSFEVTRKANISAIISVEDMVKSMIMIPGSGEYVYDTTIQKKQILAQNGSVKCEKILNSHNIHNIANSLHSLNQMSSICENIEWVAPVACWFADSLDLSSCSIMPAVEFKNPLVKFSEKWQVGKYNRNNAREITKDANGNPRYGGSINDRSVIRYLQELKNRGLKIMFYPMFFLDIEGKPWRGHLTGTAEDVKIFFNREHGYNDFIIHYAKLVRDYVDAFIIGSELIGLTKIKSLENSFPAIDELLGLADIVKDIVGPKVLVSYAADWSEYHHTEGGWYNLDPLWAAKSIDFIGIDAYFPLTNINNKTFIADKDIKEGFSSGEGYDYYIDQRNNDKIPLDPKFAWKNLRYWWENTHHNPDGSISPWQPRSKKIWFTEFGFPSIDKAPNQPNVFFDPFCQDGRVPRYSSGEIDFGIQRRCIKAFIEFWQKEEYIDNMFLWTWDARPYPAWPHMNLWKDGYLWEKGHWVNDKFGITNVAAIILEISNRCGIDLDHVMVDSLDEALSGLFFDNQLSGQNAIDILRSVYFFDISASSGEKISFPRRGVKAPYQVSSDHLVKYSRTTYLKEINIAKEQIVSKVDIYFQSNVNDYKGDYLHINNENFSNLKNATLKLPLVISKSDANRIGNLLLKNAAIERKIMTFNLPISYLNLKVTDFIFLHYQQQKYQLRIIEINLSGMIMNITAIIDDIRLYHLPKSQNQQKLIYKDSIETKFRIICFPFKPYGLNFPHLVACLNNDKAMTLYIKIAQGLEDANWDKITSIEPTNSITKIVSFNVTSKPDPFLIDEVGEIHVTGVSLERFENDINWKLIEINQELIAFKKIDKLESEEELYSISCLIRGAIGTEKYMKNHDFGSFGVIIAKNSNNNIIPVSEDLIGESLEFKVGNIISKVDFLSQSNLALKPLIISNYILDNMLHLSWISRNFTLDLWYRTSKKPIRYNIKITAKGEEINHLTGLEINKIALDVSSLDISEGYAVDFSAAE